MIDLPYSNVRIGQAHDATARTGVTVILPDRAAPCGVDVRGGGPGTRETDTLAQGNLIESVHGISLAGGSVYGLAAADGVCAWLGARGRGYVASANDAVPVSPIVPSAILFDNANGGDKAWGAEPPYRRLAMLACESAGTQIAEGRAGAGYGATAGLYPGGLGVATETIDEITVTAIIAANPVGSPYLPGTDCPHAWIYERDDEFGGTQPPADYRWSAPTDTKLAVLKGAGQSTVIGVLLTNAKLGQAALTRLAVMGQDGIALAVQPSHTPLDGDTLFALSLGEAPCDSPVALAELGNAAARATARALTRGVIKARD
jgi:D-aminopeptidase